MSDNKKTFGNNTAGNTSNNKGANNNPMGNKPKSDAGAGNAPSGKQADAGDELKVDFGDAFEEAVSEESKLQLQMEADIAKLKKELIEAKDKTMRTFAELENFRKRSARQLQDELKYANIGLIRDMLPVMDNLLRAVEAAQKQKIDGNLTEAGEALLDGVKMVVDQFNDALAKHDCIQVEALNQPFDPNYHQAITQMPSDQAAPNTVIMETQKGYVLFDRVVRPSQVIVSCEKK